MDSILQLFRSMTFWNWLALIAFIFFPLSALNAFLGLRSRFLDWRGIKNKKEFEKRLKEWEDLVAIVGLYKNDSSKLIAMILKNAWVVLRWFCLAAFIFVWAFIISISFQILAIPFLLVSQLLLWKCFTYITKVFKIIRYVSEPETLVKSIREFMASGTFKGLLPDKGENAIVEALFNQNLLTVGEVDEFKADVERWKSYNK